MQVFTNRPIWNRIGHVEIEDESHNMVPLGGSYGKNGLDFRFSVEKIGDVYIEFTVGVLGLNYETINNVVCWKGSVPFNQCRKIAVYAGYDPTGNNDAPLICSGCIYEALPTQPPEMWLNMKCINTIRDKTLLGNTTVTIGEMEIDLSEPVTLKLKYIFDICANILGLNATWNADADLAEKKVTFSFAKYTKDQLANVFASKFNLIVYTENDSLICINQYPEFQKPKETPQKISTDTGMLSIGGVDVKGARVVTRLNDNYKLFQYVELESKMMKNANGMYVVVGKKHVGHLRGNEWNTELNLIRRRY